VQVMIDDRALDPRAIEMLAAVLVRQNGGRPATAPTAGQRRPSARPSRRSPPLRGAGRETTKGEVVRVSRNRAKEEVS
jgi:hypothetical protein